MRQSLLFLICVLLPALSPGQQKEAVVDSLQRLIDQEQVDSTKARMCNELGRLLRRDNRPRAAYNHQIALDLAKAHLTRADQDSLDYLGIMGIANNNLGLIRRKQGRYADALTHYQEVARIGESIGDNDMTSSSYHNIGVLHRYMKNYSDGVPYAEKALAIRQVIQDTAAIINSLNSLGVLHRKLNEFEKAYEYYHQALKLAQSIRDIESIADGYTNLGVLAENRQQGEEAEYYYRKAISFDGRPKEKLAKGYMNLSFSLSKDAKYDSAIYYLHMARNIYEQSRYYELLTVIHMRFSKYYEDLGMYDSAYYHLKINEAFVDSLNKVENAKEVTRRELEFGFEKERIEKEKQLSEERLRAETSQAWMIGLSIGAFLLLFLAVVMIRAYNNKRKANVTIAKEKQRSEDLLLNILPEQTAEELKATGASKPRPYKEVTVLFTDFKGFTFLAEQLTADELVSEIDHCFSNFDRIVSNYRIEKIKTIGDAYMAVAGLPESYPEHASEMVQAALDIRDFMRKYKAERDAAGKPAFEIRIGLHSGPVVAGIVGIKKFAYDIWGDTVNTAARMESSGEPGKVNVSGTTQALVANQFSFEFRGKVAAKNKGEIDMYFVETLA